MAGAARCYLARIHTHQGRPAQAESEARRAALALGGEAVPLYVLAQAALTEALLAQGRADEACRAAAAGEVAAATLEALGEGEILFAVIHGEALDAAGPPGRGRPPLRPRAGGGRAPGHRPGRARRSGGLARRRRRRTRRRSPAAAIRPRRERPAPMNGPRPSASKGAWTESPLRPALRRHPPWPAPPRLVPSPSMWMVLVAGWLCACGRSAVVPPDAPPTAPPPPAHRAASAGAAAPVVLYVPEVAPEPAPAPVVEVVVQPVVPVVQRPRLPSRPRYPVVVIGRPGDWHRPPSDARRDRRALPPDHPRGEARRDRDRREDRDRDGDRNRREQARPDRDRGENDRERARDRRPGE